MNLMDFVRIRDPGLSRIGKPLVLMRTGMQKSTPRLQTAAPGTAAVGPGKVNRDNVTEPLAGV
jgi:hypothetical protein